jgi:GTP cyclohydrolase I
MLARGVEKQESEMVTSAIRGQFREITTRNEFMQLVKR